MQITNPESLSSSVCHSLEDFLTQSHKASTKTYVWGLVAVIAKKCRDWFVHQHTIKRGLSYFESEELYFWVKNPMCGSLRVPKWVIPFTTGSQPLFLLSTIHFLRRKPMSWRASQLGFMDVYACGPKTVPVKRAFLNMAIVGWGGVGWGGAAC